jgi:hypothetical protein
MNEPVHVHGKCQGREMGAELIIVNDLVVDVRFMNQPGRLPLSDSEIRFFKEIVVAKSDDIVRKWVNFCFAQIDRPGSNQQEAQAIPDVLTITHVDPLGGYRLSVGFDDGSTQVVDFEPFLAASAHPAIRVYLALDRFASYRTEHGDLVWGDYDLCFPIVDFYLNRIVIPAGDQKAA